MTVRLPPIQSALDGSGALTSISPRIYQIQAPEGAERPYTIWTLATAVPELNLASTPEDDDQRVQVDCYSESQAQARKMIQAAADACEVIGDIVYGPWCPGQEELTKLFRWSFDVEVWNKR